MSSTLHVRSVVASAFCVLDRYMSERFGRLRSTRGEGACGVSSSTLKVIGFTFYCYYPFNPFASSLFHPLAYVGCWWDLRRDSFIFLSLHYTCPWCIPGFVWFLDYQWGSLRGDGRE
jgi:hypothetical protein